MGILRKAILRGFQKTCLFAASLVVLNAGCRTAPYNRVEVVDYRDDEPEKHHFEDFDESYYRVRDGGLVDVVLRRQSASVTDQTKQIVQIIVLRSFWKPHPGRTYAEASMLSANLCYLIMKGNAAVSYEGGGFFQYREKPRKGLITGRLEGADLQLLRGTAPGLNIFGRASIAGRFRAQHNDRRAIRIMNEVDQILGPPPAIQPAHRGPDY